MIKKLYRILLKKKILSNVNKMPENKNYKRALLIYLIQPFKQRANSSKFRFHTNYWGNIEIAKILGEFGYIVDVIDYNNSKIKLKRNYDLVIGQGNAMKEIINKQSKETIKIYFATGSAFDFHNQQEKKRVEEANKRHKSNLEMIRKTDSDLNILKLFDAIICFGNDAIVSTFRPHFKKEIYNFNNYGYDETAFLLKNKNYQESRKNFLFMSGSGKVLNGLDLLLDVFKKRPNLNLYIGGSFKGEQDFVKCFYKELYQSPNIHTQGWINIGGERYNQLIAKCGIIVTAVCTAGSLGSVVVCMNNGLIPLVTKESGIDTENFGITLRSDSLKDIGETIDWISKQSPDWHKLKSEETYKIARRKFSQKAFRYKLNNIFKTIGI